jgi:hypothetical protein
VLKKIVYNTLVFTLLTGLGLAANNTVYIPQIGFGEGLETTFTFLNFSATTNRLEIRAYDSDGNEVDLLYRPGSPFEDEIAVDTLGVEVAGFGSAEAVTFSDVFSVGYAEIESDLSEPFGVEVVFRRVSPTGALLTSTSILPQPLSKAFSFLAFSDSFARTGVALVNPADNAQSANVTLTLLDRFGGEKGKAVVVLSPGAKFSQFIDEASAQAVLFPELQQEQFSGTIEVRADVPVAVAILRTEGPQFFFTTQTVQQPRNTD